ncbi:DnaJ sub C member 8 [Friedmanniomyces endolithicus]|nr:DnaJ sub C member 8 [Friedmanniomyces endolithicus]KAK0916098.1 DnaJ sub C member 8 [Friedmanniomyces endolithicus]
MAEPEKDLKKLEAEQAREDASLLANLDKEAKEYDKARPIPPIKPTPIANSTHTGLRNRPHPRRLPRQRLRHEDIKRTYRKISLLIHPDKSSNPRAPDAFDRLALAHQVLLDEKKRAILDEAIADARMLLMRDLKLTVDSEEVKDPDTVFMGKWKEKVKWVLADNEARRQRQVKAQMQEEGRERRKEEAEVTERKRKRDAEVEWEKTREGRIGSWREFSKKGVAAGGDKKKKKMKTLG